MKDYPKKIEHAIRFNNFNEAIGLCMEITRQNTYDVLIEIDKEIYQCKEYTDKRYHTLLCKLRAKLLYPKIAEHEKD